MELFPYIKIAMTHIVYFHCLLILKLLVHFSSSDQFALQKCTRQKTLVPIILNSQKIKQELGDLFCSKNPTREKLISNRAFNY